MEVYLLKFLNYDLRLYFIFLILTIYKIIWFN